MTAEKIKRGRGRPSISAEAGERFEIRLPAEVAAQLRDGGGGSLSRGILRRALGQPPLKARASPRPSRRGTAREVGADTKGRP